MIAVFASEYLSVLFDDVCDAIEGLSSEAVVSDPAGIVISDPLLRTSNGVARVAVKYCDGLDASWKPAEIRVLEVESGELPLTELLMIVLECPSAGTARSILQRFAGQLEELVLAHPVAR